MAGSEACNSRRRGIDMLYFAFDIAQGAFSFVLAFEADWFATRTSWHRGMENESTCFSLLFPLFFLASPSIKLDN
jgi:hypothetical protein